MHIKIQSEVIKILEFIGEAADEYDSKPIGNPDGVVLWKTTPLNLDLAGRDITLTDARHARALAIALRKE